MRYADFVPLFTVAEGEHIKRQCTSCQAFIHKVSMDTHVETTHRSLEDQGLLIKVNDIWWRKRGY